MITDLFALSGGSQYAIATMICLTAATPYLYVMDIVVFHWQSCTSRGN